MGKGNISVDKSMIKTVVDGKIIIPCNYSAYQKQLIDIDFYVIGTSDY